MSSAREIVDERLARGEIDLDEHARIIELLQLARETSEVGFSGSEEPVNASVKDDIAVPVVDDSSMDLLSKPKRRKWPWVLAAVGLISISLLMMDNEEIKRINPLTENPLIKKEAWRVNRSVDPITDSTIINISGTPEVSEGPVSPTISIACRNTGISFSIHFGVPMKNSHKGTKLSLATVKLRLDGSGDIPLVFTPSADWTTVSALDYSSPGDALTGAGVAIDNLIFNALGIKNTPRSDWSATRLVRQMAGSNYLTIRGQARSGHTITARYELAKFRGVYGSFPAQCKK